MLSLFSIQLANAAALFGVFAVPLLVFAYLKRKSRRPRVVSSVIILQDLQKRRTINRRFKPPLRFFLELLALLALIGGASMPSFKDENERAAVLIDNSMSMRAASGGTNRLGLARAAAEKWIDSQSGDMRFTVFAASPTLSQIGESDLSAGAATGVIAGIEAALAADALEAAAAELTSSGTYDRLVFVTDKAGTLTEDLLGGGTKSEELTRVEVVSVGDPAPNVYLANLRIMRSGLEAGDMQLVATLGYSGPAPASVGVVLFDGDAGEGRVPNRLAQRKEATVVPDRMTEVSFPIDPPSAEEGRLFKVEVSPDDASQNALIEDDFGWISEGAAAQAQALLITPLASDDALGLNAIAGLSFARVSPSEYGVLGRDELAKYRLLVFHLSAPAAAPPVPSLLILPPPGNPLFNASDPVERPNITSWAADHPITSYLRIPLIQPSEAVLLETPIWAQSVLNVEAGTLLAAGETRGVRYSAVGMELLPFEGARTPSSSVLMLNLVNWLSGGEKLTSELLTGASLRLQGHDRWVISTPAQQSEEILPEEGALETPYVLERPGVYHIAAFSRGESASAAERRMITVNSFFPQESSTYERAPLVVPETVRIENTRAETNEPLWQLLMAAALCLLMLELLLGVVGRREAQAI